MSARAILRNVVVISKNLEWPPSSFKVTSTESTSAAFDSYFARNYLSSLYHFVAYDKLRSAYLSQETSRYCSRKAQLD